MMPIEQKKWEVVCMEKLMKISDLRNRYNKDRLDENKAGNDPVALLEQWLKEAIDAEVMEPTAMILSTADEQGRPDSRVVLLKGIQDGKPVFYTNYLSNKGRQIALNLNVALLFFWPESERQIRISGQASKLTASESDEYFESRPLESRVGAIVSPQSQVIANRTELEAKFEEMLSNSDLIPLKRPDHWGGYKVEIREAEFWQGRPGRLHDRIRFRRKNNIWIGERLAP